MSKPPLPEAAVTMLAKPNPSVIATLRPDGQPVSAATWYLWDNGRALVNMDEGRIRLEHMRNDPRVTLTVLDGDDWYTTVTIIGLRQTNCSRTPTSPNRPRGPPLHGQALPAAGPASVQCLDQRRPLVRLGIPEGQQPEHRPLTVKASHQNRS